MTCFQFYQFAVNASDFVNTNVDVNITWNGDLGGFIQGTITIFNGTTCNTGDFFSNNINCGGEFLSFADLSFNPPSNGSQTYVQGGTYGDTPFFPC